ncbi:MAG: flagellar basal body-associated FliL family protein [Pseudomonadota bacterium]
MAEEKAPKEGKKKKKFSLKAIIALLPAILIGLNLVGMGLGGYLSYMGTIGMTPESIRETEARKMLYQEEVFDDKPVVYSLDPFTVNLADVDDSRIVQVRVTLEMLDENGFEEVVSMGAHARDTIVTILNGKRFLELQSIQGKLFLKDEITVALNKQLKRSFIKDVYFSRFVLQ